MLTTVPEADLRNSGPEFSLSIFLPSDKGSSDATADILYQSPAPPVSSSSSGHSAESSARERSRPAVIHSEQYHSVELAEMMSQAHLEEIWRMVSAT